MLLCSHLSHWEPHGRKSVHFQKLRDSSVRKAGLTDGQVPRLDSDLHRPSGCTVPACCVSMRPAAVLEHGLFAICTACPR